MWLFCFLASYPPFPNSTVAIETVDCILDAVCWCQKVKYELCYQNIVPRHFDLSGDYLRDQHRSLPLLCPPLVEAASQTDVYQNI